QTRYGASIQAATLSRRRKAIIVQTIAGISRQITAKPAAGLWLAKNANDQATFRTSCTANGGRALFPARRPPDARMTRQRATAINANRMVHTTGKAQLGGVKLGLDKVAYQSRFGTVAVEPSRAAAKQTR